MNVLIVDDQYDKVKIFAAMLKDIENLNLVTVTNIKDALNSLSKHKCDILILDLKIPDCLEEDINPRGGVELLEFIEQNERYSNPTHIIAATSHKDAYDEFEQYFKNRGWRLLYFPDNEDEFRTIVNSLARHSSAFYDKYDVAIITALDHTEQEAVLALPCDWRRVTFIDDTDTYYRGMVHLPSGRVLRIITACCPRMGIASSASLSTKLILRHQPRFLIMTGIAAGIKKKTNIGDILVADPTWDWGSGKLTVREGKPVFMSAPHQLQLRHSMRQRLKELAVQRKYLDEIYDGWLGSPSERPRNPINLHIGPVASGAVVLEDPATVQLILAQHRETVGIEMEAYGLMAAAEYATESKYTDALAIKSVCDFANPKKNNKWQRYAAYTSAFYAFKLITNELSFD